MIYLSRNPLTFIFKKPKVKEFLGFLFFLAIVTCRLSLNFLDEKPTEFNKSDSNLPFTIREATVQDIPNIAELMREIKIFHERDPNTVSEEKLLKYGFGTKPRFKVDLAIVGNKIVGFSLYYISFSGFNTAPELCLEDLYIQPQHRGIGIGTAFFDKLKEYCKNEECFRIFFLVSKWNEDAIKFYEKMGAKPSDDLVLFRMRL